MANYITAHVTTCMTRQDLNRLTRRLLQDAAGEVELSAVRCDTGSGRMVCDWEAPDQETLVQWLSDRHIHFRSNEEWCMRVQLTAKDGRMTPA